MKKLLELQELDLKIEELKAREAEIPKQKNKYKQHRARLAAELEASEKRHKDLVLEQRNCESEIDLKQADIAKKDGQLLQVKKNEEYQALLHEIEMLKKQISIHEERILASMEEADVAAAQFEEDKKRIAAEQKEIEAACAVIDEELAKVTAERTGLEQERDPLLQDIDTKLLKQYNRIRKSKRGGPAVVPMRGESCSGCNMLARAQMVNEILAGDQFHACNHCGRLLYNPEQFAASEAAEAGE